MKRNLRDILNLMAKICVFFGILILALHKGTGYEINHQALTATFFLAIIVILLTERYKKWSRKSNQESVLEEE